MLFQKRYKEDDKFRVLAVHDNQALIAENYGNSCYTPCYLIEIDGLTVVDDNEI
jgi:hypothetical protein